MYNVNIPIFSVAYKDFKLSYTQYLTDYALIFDADKQTVWICLYCEEKNRKSVFDDIGVVEW